MDVEEKINAMIEKGEIVFVLRDGDLKAWDDWDLIEYLWGNFESETFKHFSVFYLIKRIEK